MRDRPHPEQGYRSALGVLGLTGMADAWRALAEQDPGQTLDRDEWLDLMLDREAWARADKRFAARRGLDRRQILALAQGDWIKAKKQIILTGQTGIGKTGTGKTWLACAFGHQAARLDHSVLYVRMPRLFEDMAMARPDGRFS